MAKLKKVIDLKSTRMDLNPNIPAPEDRPRCTKPGCDNPKHIYGVRKDGSPQYRRVCAKHHADRICEIHGVPSPAHVTAARQGITVSEYATKIMMSTAKKKGITITALRRSYNPYQKHMKDYCENIDGRLGFNCTSTIIPDHGMLQVDHINGKPNDDRPKNLQTLCACCHAYKTNKNKDYSTPGRKTLKKLKLVA